MEQKDQAVMEGGGAKKGGGIGFGQDALLCRIPEQIPYGLSYGAIGNTREVIVQFKADTAPYPRPVKCRVSRRLLKARSIAASRYSKGT